MNIHAYKISSVNGPGNRFTLWTQGCSKGCVNCFNPETWNNRDNIIISPLEIFEHIKDFELDGVTITGGDPFEQEDELLELLILIDELNLSKGVIVFSGFTYDEIRDNKIREKCCDYIDVLIDGRYEDKNRVTDSFKGSSNQNIIYFSSKLKEEELNMDQEVEVSLSNDIICITGFPSVDKKFLKEFGITVKSSL
jgi:anaerobic ribonucleoside-triphosphate reductase activating protein